MRTGQVKGGVNGEGAARPRVGGKVRKREKECTRRQKRNLWP